MSLSQSLTNALSGLTAASRMAEVVSANLANALTDGYGRRVVELSAQTNGARGGGVQVDGIARLVDRGLLADRRGAEAVLGAHGLTARSLARIEGAVGLAGSADSLTGRLDALETALIATGADPSSDLALDRVRQRFEDLAAGFRQAAAAIQSERAEADRQVAADVDVLNRSLIALEDTNGAISAARAAGQDTASLVDQRQQIVDRIARIVPVREIDRPGGQIALVTTGGEILIDGRAREIGFQAVGAMTADMTHASGALSGLSIDGKPVNASDGIGRLDGGTLAAAMRLRDERLPAVSQNLDALAGELIARFADPATDPSLSAAMAGVLTDAGGPLDPVNITGLAGRIAVNAAIDPARGGALWRLRDGLGTAAAGPVGQSLQIGRWSDAIIRSSVLGGAAGNAADHLARLSAEIGNDRVLSEEAESFASARFSALREAELSGGVDSDHELQMLLRIEQAYAANARVMTALDDMLGTLLEI